MPYITSVERIGREEGKQEGLRADLRVFIASCSSRTAFSSSVIRCSRVASGMGRSPVCSFSW